MPATTSALVRASRPAFRSSNYYTQASQIFRTRAGAKRWQTNAGAGTNATGESTAAQASWFKRMWDSPIGLKTVHFWAPVMKWSIVLAGVADFARPAEKLSLTQNFALTCTGAIWTRWCLIIKPRNVLLATVNFFLGCVGVVQVTRILNYRYSAEGKAAAAAEAIKDDAKASIVDVKEKVKDVVGA